MSSRQLRKLQKQKELELLARAAEEDASESGDEAPIQKQKPSLFSSFSALAGDEDEEEGGREEPDAEPQVENEEDVPAQASKPAAKKHKKKKKKAKKGHEDSNSRGTPREDAEHPALQGVDDIDRAIRELNLASKSSNNATEPTSEAAKAYEHICELLRINTYHLKVLNEMRNLFGREAIAAAEHEEAEDEQSRNRRRPHQRLQQNVDLETYLKGIPGRTLPEVTLRRNPFLAGREHWPHASTEGLTMKQIQDGTVQKKCGTVEFGFAHDERYNNLETQFFGLVQMYDPMQLVHFLRAHPYHISTLIQVSKVAKQDQNSALAADLCERALFTFGRVSLSGFRQKLEEGKARLEFRRPENRQFWLAGYHYLKSLGMKGTYRTALEWAKLLLSMDLTDPYGIMHFLHPLAIRAHESKWFIDFCDSEALDECDTAQDYIRQTLVLARLQQDDMAGAKALAIEGMERLPWLYSSLFKALNLDVPRAIWGTEPRDDHEQLFTELYIHQTKALWDNAQATSLLKDAASMAQKANPASLSPPPVAGRNVGRFVYLDNTPALMSQVPDGMLHSFPNWEFDPLPPAKEENIFSYESQKYPWNQDRSGSSLNHDGLPFGLPPRDVLQRLIAQGAGPQQVQAEIRRHLENALRELREARGGELPPDVQRQLDELGLPDPPEETEQNEENEEDGAPGEEDEDTPETRAGLLRTLLGLVWPVRAVHEHDDRDDEGEDGDELQAPGGWISDDEMPPLVPSDEHGDDEIPPLVSPETHASDTRDDSDDEMPHVPEAGHEREHHEGM